MSAREPARRGLPDIRGTVFENLPVALKRRQADIRGTVFEHLGTAEPALDRPDIRGTIFEKIGQPTPQKPEVELQDAVMGPGFAEGQAFAQEAPVQSAQQPAPAAPAPLADIHLTPAPAHQVETPTLTAVPAHQVADHNLMPLERYPRGFNPEYTEALKLAYPGHEPQLGYNYFKHPALDRSFLPISEPVRSFVGTPESTTGKLAAGAATGLADLAEAVATPKSIGLMAGAAAAHVLNPVVAVLVDAGFAIDMARQAVKMAPEVFELAQSGDIQGAAEAAIMALASGAGALAAGVGVGVKGAEVVRGSRIPPRIEGLPPPAEPVRVPTEPTRTTSLPPAAEQIPEAGRVPAQPAQGSAGAFVSRKPPESERPALPAGPLPQPPPSPEAAPTGTLPPGRSVLERVDRITAQEPKPERPSLGQRVREIPRRLQTAVISEFTPLRHAEKEIFKLYGKERPTLDLARKFELTAGAAGKAEADITSFERAVEKPVKGLEKDLENYLFMRRTLSRLKDDPKRKRVGDFTVEDMERGLLELRDRVGEEGIAKIESAAEAFQQEMDKALRLQVESGRMSKDLYRKVKASNDFYAPFKLLRYLEESDAFGGAGRNISNTQKVIKAITGIDSTDFSLSSFLLEAKKQIYKSRLLAEQNFARRELAKVAHMEIAERGAKGEFFRPGEPTRYYQIKAEPAEQILNQLNLQQTARNPQLLEQSFVKVGRALMLAEELGLKVKYKNLPKALGRAELSGIEKGGRISLRAFTSEVIAHELAHAFDVPLRDAQGKKITVRRKVFGRPTKIEKRLSSVINSRKGTPFGKRPIFQQELAKLVDFTGLGGSQKYRNSAVERFAEFVSLYIHDPYQARNLAPKFTEFFEKKLLPKNKIKVLVERLGEFYRAVDKLPNILTPLKEMDDHNYLELAIRKAFPNKKPQLGVRFGTKPDLGFKLTTYWENGVLKGFQARKDIAKAVDGLNRGEAQVVSRLLSASRSLLRAGATTYNLPFVLPNIVTDVARAAVMSKYGIRSPLDLYRFPLGWLRAFYSAMTGTVGHPDELYMEFLRSGAAYSTIQRALTPRSFGPEFLKNRTFRRLGAVLDTLPKFINATDEATKVLGIKRGFDIEGIKRLSPAERAKKVQEVATEVRNHFGSPNFFRYGAMASLNLLFMFFNARVQGTASDLARLVGQAGKAAALVAHARLAALVGIPLTALYVYIYSDPQRRKDYEGRPLWEREHYVMIPRNQYFINENGEKVPLYWRIPKREIFGLHAGLIEDGVKFGFDREPAIAANFAGEFFEWAAPFNIEGKNLRERAESVVSSTNPLIKSAIEYGTGRDTFRHRDIEPRSIAGVTTRYVPTEKQYRKSTPKVFRELGATSPARSLGISPLEMDHLTRSFTGGMLSQAFPRQRPGRSKILSVPFIGPALGRFVSSDYVDNSGDVEGVEQALMEQGSKRVDLNRKAERVWERLKQELVKLQPDERVELMNAFSEQAPQLAKRVLRIAEEEQQGLSYAERLMRQLGVENGARARFVAKKVLGLPAGERRAYLDDLRAKKILSEKTEEQLIQILSWQSAAGGAQ